MLQTIQACPLCDSGHFQSSLVCKDHLVTQKEFTIVKCDDCGLLFTNPRPTDKTLGNYYKAEQYISHTNKGNSPINWVYKLVRNYTLGKKLNLINKYQNPGKILDYGCGTGNFLNRCANNNWVAFGVEPDEDARQIASNQNEIEIANSLSNIKEEAFDVISLWHVLEHVTDLKQTMQSLVQKLKEEGTMIIAVPNPNSYDAQTYKEQWAAYDVPRHLYHFTQETIAKLATQQGLKLIETRPMIFDSYYVSMLSDKNIFGTLKPIKSFISGYQSNSYAKNNDNNYSSLIYIFSK